MELKPAVAPLNFDVSALLHKPHTRMLGNRKLFVGSTLCAAVLLVAIILVGQWVTPLATETNFLQKNLPPSWDHPFGTDWMGRDMFLRTLSGLSLSVLIGLGAALASSCIALVLGILAALGGKYIDGIISWLIDLMMGIPHIVLLILISFALGKGFWGVVIGIALTHWPSLTRIIRAEILQCKNSGFVATAKHLGVKPWRIALTHMLPYVLPQFLVGMILMFPHAILHEAAITFLGFGLSPEQPAIGIILSESMAYLTSGMWWLAVFPGLALVAVVMLFDVVGNGVRRLVEPRSAQL